VIPVPQLVDPKTDSPLRNPATPHSFEARIENGVLRKMREMETRSRKHSTLMTKRMNSVFLAYQACAGGTSEELPEKCKILEALPMPLLTVLHPTQHTRACGG